MTDEIYRSIDKAFAEYAFVKSVFSSVSRVADDSGDIVRARISSVDGGVWTLSVIGTNVDNVLLMHCAVDGGVAPSFATDMTIFCLDLDVSSHPKFVVSLRQVLVNAALSYIQIQGLVRVGDVYVPPALPAGPAGKADAVAPAQPPGDRKNPLGVHNDQVQKGRPKRAARQPPKSATTYNAPVFTTSPGTTRILSRQLREISKSDTRRLNFSVDTVDGNLYVWKVAMYFADMNSSLARDLRDHPTQNHIDLEIRFPDSYPTEPPFCRILGPNFDESSGIVLHRGAICAQLLTTSGWYPGCCAENLLVSLHAILSSSKCRLNLRKPNACARYTLKGALSDMGTIVKLHRWGLSPAPG